MIEYFYIIAISWTVGAHVNVRSQSGIAELLPGQDQRTIYDLIFTETCKSYGAPIGSVATTYYYVARNEP